MSGTRVRSLQDPSSDSVWSSMCNGATVVVRSGKRGKEKETEKPMPDDAAAVTYAEKEEWARLKKGFVLNEPDATPGQPRMHCYLQTGHFIEALGEKIVTSKRDNKLELEFVHVLGEDGSIIDTIALPEKNTTAWTARYHKNKERLLLSIDHQIFSYSFQNRSFEKLTERNRKPASFLSLSGSLAAWYAEPEIVAFDLNSQKTVFRTTVNYEMYSGHSPQMKAELSPDGTKIACCFHSGEIVLFDIASGKELDTYKGNFAMVEKLAFTPDGNRLVIQEQYGDWKVFCLDLRQMQEAIGWPKIAEMASGDFAIESTGRRMAVSRRNWIEIFDLETMQCILKIRAEHVVKGCAITFIGKFLGVRTDYGCASLYALE